MTDRHIGYLVTLTGAIREDDAQNTLNAIRALRNVVSAEPVTSDILAESVAATRRDTQWARALSALIRSGPDVGGER